ncbi:MAG: hypothetical protein IJG50_06150 [Clostridia bacterium]|nr:hypothetical protein [Clostridia bacterium]
MKNRRRTVILWSIICCFTIALLHNFNVTSYAADIVYEDQTCFFDYSENLFNDSAVETGSYIFGDGRIVAQKNSQVLNDYIPIESGERYSWSQQNGLLISTYDENLQFIERMKPYVSPAYYNKVFSDNVRFVRLSCYNNRFSDGFMFVKGDLPNEYVPYATLKTKYLPEDKKNTKTEIIDPYLQYVAFDPNENFGDATVKGAFSIYTPIGAHKYLKLEFLHNIYPEYVAGADKKYKNGDLWRLNHGIECSITEGGFVEEREIIENGAYEAALYLNNKGSAVGSFHGYEKFNRCIVLLDGKTVMDVTREINSAYSGWPSDFDITSCKEVEIMYWGDIYQMATQTKIVECFRHYTINSNGIAIKQRHKWLVAGTHGGFLGMLCVKRVSDDGNQQITDSGICDMDYVVYDISKSGHNTAISQLTDKQGDHNNVHWSKVWGKESGITAEVTVDYDNWFYISPEKAYNKLYFRKVENTERGGNWDTVSIYKIKAG